MPSFEVDREEITVFKIGDTYLFKQYFDQDQAFDKLEKYYNRDKYRFEIPEDDIGEVKQILDNFFYDMEVKSNIMEYCVVLDRDGDSTEVLKNSVIKSKISGIDIYLIKYKLSAKQAAEQGASQLKETEVDSGELEWEIARS